MKVFKFGKKKQIEKSDCQKEIENLLKSISEEKMENKEVIDKVDVEIKDCVSKLMTTDDPDEYKETLDRISRLISLKKCYNDELNDKIENLKKLVDVKASVDGENKKKLDPNVVLHLTVMLVGLILTLFHEKINIIPKNGWSFLMKIVPNIKK